jgi:hypothetical protein
MRNHLVKIATTSLAACCWCFALGPHNIKGKKSSNMYLIGLFRAFELRRISRNLSSTNDD